jgi:hypothetical protein
MQLGASREKAREEMTVVTPDGSVLRAIFAFREISRPLLALWLLVSVMFAPGATCVGTRVYAWAAANRERRVRAEESCAVARRAIGGAGQRECGGD